MKWHPDKNKDDPRAQEMFQDLSAAYEVCLGWIIITTLDVRFWIINSGNYTLEAVPAKTKHLPLSAFFSLVGPTITKMSKLLFAGKLGRYSALVVRLQSNEARMSNFITTNSAEVAERISQSSVFSNESLFSKFGWKVTYSSCSSYREIISLLVRLRSELLANLSPWEVERRKTVSLQVWNQLLSQAGRFLRAKFKICCYFGLNVVSAPDWFRG